MNKTPPQSKIKDLLKIEESTPHNRADFVPTIGKIGELIEWRLPDGRLHRKYGPAVESEDYTAWLIQNQFHRADGPARIWKNGSCEWWVLGVKTKFLVVKASGTKMWYNGNDVLHRIDGPAIEYSMGAKRYFIEGVPYSEEEFHEVIKRMKEK